MRADRAEGRPESPSSGGLPQGFRELRREVLRRLALMEREVRSLGEGPSDPRLLASVVILEEMERELRQELTTAGDPADWSRRRKAIVDLWRRHRREFERLAALCRRMHAARSGRRDSGPRW